MGNIKRSSRRERGKPFPQFDENKALAEAEEYFSGNSDETFDYKSKFDSEIKEFEYEIAVNHIRNIAGIKLEEASQVLDAIDAVSYIEERYDVEFSVAAKAYLKAKKIFNSAMNSETLEEEDISGIVNMVLEETGNIETCVLDNGNAMPASQLSQDEQKEYRELTTSCWRPKERDVESLLADKSEYADGIPNID